MDSVIAEIESAGAEYLAVRTNVTDEGSVRSLMKQVYQKWGRIEWRPDGLHIGDYFLPQERIEAHR